MDRNGACTLHIGERRRKQLKTIIINKISIQLERKRIKNMYLKVLPPEGRIHITAPLRMSEDEIRSFVLSKLDWIGLQQEKLRQRHTHQELKYVTGEEIYVWGMPYTLVVSEKTGASGIDWHKDGIILTCKHDSITEERKRILDRWYREELNKRIPDLIGHWEKVMGVKASGFRIRDMKTRWGTCNTRTGNICLSLQLAKKAPRCLEYVVVHELAHLLEGSHNSRFKAYMDQFLPDWRQIKKEMNGSVIL